MKADILAHLSQSETAVSGEHLSRVLGVSRVAVWKHIHQLQEFGYSIESTPKGYRLLGSPDTPFAWVFGHRADKVHYYPQVASTMDKAMELARADCPAFTVVVSDRQTKGRGRLQRKWQSNKGGLYFTLVLRPEISPAHSALVNLAAAVDLATTLEEIFDIPSRVKWPNDVLVNERKVAGILSQMEAESDRVAFINIGMGINVNNDPRAYQPKAVSIARLIGRKASRVEILAAFLDRFEQRMERPVLSEVIEQWKQRTVTLDRQVQVQTFDQTFQGLAVDIEPNGSLVLETTDGERLSVTHGDCFHQDKN